MSIRDLADLGPDEVQVTCEPWLATGPTESEQARSERVEAAQKARLASGSADPEPWSPDAVAIDLMRNPEIRRSAFGRALTTHGCGRLEVYGPGPRQLGPLEREWLQLERHEQLKASLAAHGWTREAYRLAGVAEDQIPDGVPEPPRRPVNPFAD